MFVGWDDEVLCVAVHDMCSLMLAYGAFTQARNPLGNAWADGCSVRLGFPQVSPGFPCA